MVCTPTVFFDELKKNLPTTPTKVKSCSYLTNLVDSSRSISLGFIGLSQVARAKQRRVLAPVPYSMAVDMILLRIAGVMACLSPPIL